MRSQNRGREPETVDQEEVGARKRLVRVEPGVLGVGGACSFEIGGPFGPVGHHLIVHQMSDQCANRRFELDDVFARDPLGGVSISAAERLQHGALVVHDLVEARSERREPLHRKVDDA